MKKFIAAAIGAVGFLVSACSPGGYGTVTGQANLTGANGNPGGSTPAPTPASNVAIFRLATGQLPYPTDLYFANSTDFTLNIQPPNPVMPNQASVNQIDGFSTNAVIREQFGGPLDPASLTAASVIIIPVLTSNEPQLALAPVQVAGAPLTLGKDFSVAPATDADVGSQILEITPLHPLAPSTCLGKLPNNCTTSTGYLVILNDGIKDASGKPAVPDTDYATIKAALPTCAAITDPTLHGVCQLVGAHMLIAQGVAQQIPQLAPSLDPAHIVLSFSFTTESTVDALASLAATTVPPANVLKANPTGLNTQQITQNPLVPGHANVYVGVLKIPYYLSKAQPLTGYWHAPPARPPLDPTSTAVTRFNPLPVPTETLMIPVLITVPNASSKFVQFCTANPPCPPSWPVLIYQHGVVVNREYMLPVADSFADAGFVVVTIDLPLHGVTDKNDPLYATDTHAAYTGLIPQGTGSIERTFDLDLNTNTPDGTSVIPGSPPDTKIDPTGSHFLNLASPLTARDNFREAAADLITLERALPQLAASGVPIDTTQIHFMGHSMGGIVGTMFTAVVPFTEVSSVTLANAGGNWSLLAQTSPSFSPTVLEALAAQGLFPGTTLFAQFFRDIQTVVDSGDPLNYIGLTAAQHPVYMTQVVGAPQPPASCTPDAARHGLHGCPDQTVPPPTTQALITASAYLPTGPGILVTPILGAQAPVVTVQPCAPAPPVCGIRGYVSFTDGYHASLIDPKFFGPVTVEMQTEAVSFTGVPIPPAIPAPNPPGSTLLIADPAVIK